jgi:predicted AAA+ superfamily ATPase
MYKRLLKMDIPPRQSAFLWGARKTGKSTYLKMTFPEATYYDLLKSELYFQFLKAPHLFREEILSIESEQPNSTIIVDEVQKIPALLDNIHWLIENTTAQFILCGSSARKLKKEGVNMLGGRA